VLLLYQGANALNVSFLGRRRFVYYVQHSNVVLVDTACMLKNSETSCLRAFSLSGPSHRQQIPWFPEQWQWTEVLLEFQYYCLIECSSYWQVDKFRASRNDINGNTTTSKNPAACLPQIKLCGKTIFSTFHMNATVNRTLGCHRGKPWKF